nr:FAD-dependent oxidoreductase [Bacillus velezensis]
MAACKTRNSSKTIRNAAVRQTAAHHTDKFAELVCSNSLRSNTLANAVGVLKEEMRPDSAIIQSADKCSVPAGGALAVDRHEFAQSVTDLVKNHPNVTVLTEEVTKIPEEPTVIATGSRLRQNRFHSS